MSPHTGTTDVDLVIRLAVEQDFATYKTLATNLRHSGFEPDQHSYQWSRQVDRARVTLEFLCETDHVEAGRIYTTRQQTGSGFGAVNIPGAQLAAQDFAEVEVEAERLDGGGMSESRFKLPAYSLSSCSRSEPSKNATTTRTPTISYTRFSTTQAADLALPGVLLLPARYAVMAEYSNRSTHSANGSSMSSRTDRTPMPTSWKALTTRTARHGSVTKQ